MGAAVVRAARSNPSRWALALLMGGAGVFHLVSPGAYRQIVPRFIGHGELVVAASGVAEIACAISLAVPRTRRIGGLATAALLVAVFPANVQMALNGGLPGLPFPLGTAAAAWARLPLQLPLVLWALAVSGSGRLRRRHRRAPLPTSR